MRDRFQVELELVAGVGCRIGEKGLPPGRVNWKWETMGRRIKSRFGYLD